MPSLTAKGSSIDPIVEHKFIDVIDFVVDHKWSCSLGGLDMVLFSGFAIVVYCYTCGDAEPHKLKTLRVYRETPSSP